MRYCFDDKRLLSFEGLFVAGEVRRL